MHYQLEVIMPPAKDIEKALERILKPFSENTRQSYKNDRFWDWYVIGGRWTGNKFIAQFDEKKLDEFHQWMKDEHVTVSSFQAGKQELNPESQIEKVDKKWNEMFPSERFLPCPIFKHSEKANLPGDIMRLIEVPKETTASRVIVATPDMRKNKKTGQYEYTGPLKAKFMVSEDFYNGLNYQKTQWDGRVLSAFEKYKEDYKNATDEWSKANLPTDEWLVVTVDYHS